MFQYEVKPQSATSCLLCDEMYTWRDRLFPWELIIYSCTTVWVGNWERNQEGKWWGNLAEGSKRGKLGGFWKGKNSNHRNTEQGAFNIFPLSWRKPMKKEIFTMIKFSMRSFFSWVGFVLFFFCCLFVYFKGSTIFMAGKSENLPETFFLRLFKRPAQLHSSQPHYSIPGRKIQEKNWQKWELIKGKKEIIKGLPF